MSVDILYFWQRGYKTKEIINKNFIIPGFILFLLCLINAVMNYVREDISYPHDTHISDLIHCILCFIVTILFAVDSLAILSDK